MTAPLLLPPAPFYLVRHGETEANAAQRAAGGRLDTPLTANGILQAKILAEKIRDLEIKPSKIYHSSLSRARDTASYINHHLGLDMVEMPELIEHIFGDWENVSWDIILPEMKKGNYDPPNGETNAQFVARVTAAFHTLLSAPHDAPPMIVAHGGIFRALRLAYGQQPSHISNCEMHLFTPRPVQTEFPWLVEILHQGD